MRDDDPAHGPARQGAGEQVAPDRAGAPGIEPGVDHRPAVAVIERVEIDMVERHRQRQAQPEDALGHLGRGALGWRFRPGIADAVPRGIARAVHHAARSPGDSAMTAPPPSRASARCAA